MLPLTVCLTMDGDMLHGIRNSLLTAVEEYLRCETEYRELARQATSESQRSEYIRYAVMYKRQREQLWRSLQTRPSQQASQVAPRVVTVTQLFQEFQQPQRPHQHQQARQVPHHSIPQAPIAVAKPIVIPSSFRNNLPADIPSEFLCPITMDIMTDPVQLTDGNVYERQAIETWLQTKDISPLTKANVDKNIRIPCFALRSLIEAYINDAIRPKQASAASAASAALPASAAPPASKEKIKKRQPSTYNLFVKERMAVLKETHPNTKANELIKLIAIEWKNKAPATAATSEVS